MKKIFSMMMTVALLVAGVAMTGCNSNTPDQPKEVKTYKVSIQASKGADEGTQANGPKKVLGLDGTTLNATWAAGEEVTVYNDTKKMELAGTLVAQYDGESTKLEGSLTGTIEYADVLILKFLAPDYNNQEGTLDYISGHCDYATASVTVASVAGDKIEIAGGIALFANQQAIVKFSLLDKADDNTISAKKLVVTVAGTSYVVTPASATNALYVAIPGFDSQNITLDAFVGDDHYFYSKAGVTFNNGKYYTVSVKMTKQTDPVYLYTVSISPRIRVQFSSGNLQYQASSGTWRFAPYQYEYIGAAAGNTTAVDSRATQSDWIDLFGWGTSGESGKYPYMTSMNNADYVDVDAGEFPAAYDWGTAFGSGWRTLTKDEWYCVLAARKAIEDGWNHQFTQAVINTDGTAVKGLILFPDGFDGTTAPTGVTWGVLDGPSNWSTNSTTCTKAGWASLEALGCTFLPTTGQRKGVVVADATTYGRYWSSTAVNETHKTSYGYQLVFQENSVHENNHVEECWGGAVRLVKNYPGE